MSNCCAQTGCELEKLRKSQSKTLKIVLAVNCLMFGFEFIAGIIAGSTALLADSLDMLGDSLVYGFSLYVVARDDIWKAKAAYAKSLVMFLFGIFVLFEAAWKFSSPMAPQYEMMGSVGFVALLANGICLFLLTRHRQEDVNMRSIWLCSRNDIFANVAVLAAALGVFLTASRWPDIVVGVAIAALFLHSSVEVFRDARDTIRKQSATRENDPVTGMAG